MNRIARNTGLASLALTLSLGMAACGSEDEPAASADTASETTSETPTEEPMTETSEEPMAAGPFGPGCAGVPTEGEGSVEGMANDPVATAASNNPLLKTLVAAVTAAGLVDTLNSAEGITVFAPSDDAFAKIPAKDLNALLKDKEALTAVLTHHVVPETLTPENLAGTFQTLNKDELVVEGSGENFTADAEEMAKVVCGNVQTANATVYVIDTVMMPQM